MTASEFTELQKRVAMLEKNAAPKGGAVPPVQPKSAKAADEPRRVVVTNPESNILLDARMPSDRDLLSLLSIARAAYPSLRPEGWSEARATTEFNKDFCAVRLAFRWLFDVGRGHLDLHHTVNFWADRVQGFAIFHRIMDVQIGGKQLLCACIAAGDVEFLAPDLYPPNLSHAGLREGYGGRPADSRAWQRVLTTGRAPFASKYRPMEYARGDRTIRCAQ